MAEGARRCPIAPRWVVAIAAGVFSSAVPGASWAAPVMLGGPSTGSEGSLLTVRDPWSPSASWRGVSVEQPGSSEFSSRLRSDSPAFGYRYAPAPHYGLQPHRPRVIAPKAIQPRVTEGAPRPWTAQWYAYCSEKYATFDRRTGSFVTYAGRRRLCR